MAAKGAQKSKPGAAPNGETLPLGLLPEPGNVNFSGQLASVPEFMETKQTVSGEISIETKDPCSKRGKGGEIEEFEVAPHQRFVRSFMSSATPYNSLLLFHGLGSGKTCAAMQVAEETFNSLASTGTPRRTFVVAAPNLQSQFKKSLFDPEKLVNINGVWRLPGCVSSELLAEALPDPRSAEQKETILKRLDQAVNRRYRFVGPEQLANMVNNVLKKQAGIASKQQRLAAEKKAMTDGFGHRLYIVDEAHDLRVSGSSNTKKAWEALKKIAEKAESTRLLLLTATPVFDTASDIVSLLNLLLLNDGRPALRAATYFTADGKLRNEQAAVNMAKAVSGYVSFVSSQDEKAFPHLLMPDQIGYKQPSIPLPTIPFGKQEEADNLRILDLAYVTPSAYQNGILEALINKLKSTKRGIGHTELGKVIMALNFVYPGFTQDSKKNVEGFIGDKGLLRTVRNLSGAGSSKRAAGPYVYDPAVEQAYGDIFARPNIQNYSAKIHRILEETDSGRGIVLVYSQYLESGAVPLALALERGGYVRSDGPALWDSTSGASAQPGKGGYVLITGDKSLSPNNSKAIAMAAADDNKNGENVRVVIISQAGSQGVDLRNVRQVHLIDPWYNLGRAEQIIGRARRRCSHALLPPNERNVSVYMYSTLLKSGEEAPDSYVYNMAAGKAIEGGMITRALKEWAVDCWLRNTENDAASDATISEQIASNGVTTKVSSAPRPYSFACDYQAECQYSCGGTPPTEPTRPVYGDRLLEIALPNILRDLRSMFTKRVYYSRDEIMEHFVKRKGYLPIQIDTALTQIVTQPEQWVVNPRGVIGHVENLERFYMFVPVGLEGARLTLEDRLVGANIAPQSIELEAPKTKLGVTKVYKESKDVVNKAARLFKKANREAIFVDIAKGTFDIAWDQAAVNAMYDEREQMRAGRVLKTIAPLSDLGELSELGTHILDHEVAILPSATKLMLLRAGAAGELSTKLSKEQELKLRDVLRELSGPFRSRGGEASWVGVYAFGNIEEGKLEYHTVVDDGTVRRSTPQEIVEHKAQRIEMPEAASVHGLIAPHRKQYLTFKVVDVEASAKQTGWQCGQASKRNVLTALNKVIGEETFTTKNTNKVGSSRELCIDLELILRAYEARDKDNKTWIYTYEQLLLKEQN